MRPKYPVPGAHHWTVLSIYMKSTETIITAITMTAPLLTDTFEEADDKTLMLGAVGLALVLAASTTETALPAGETVTAAAATAEGTTTAEEAVEERVGIVQLLILRA